MYTPIERKKYIQILVILSFDTQKNDVQIEGKETTSIVNFSARRRIYPWWNKYKWGGRHFDIADAICISVAGFNKKISKKIDNF